MKLKRKEEKDLISILNKGLSFSYPTFDCARDSERVVLAAIDMFHHNNINEVYELMSDRLQMDRTFLKDIAINHNLEIIKYSELLRNDEVLIKEIFHNDRNGKWIYRFELPCLSNDKEATIEAVKVATNLMEHTSPTLRDDKEFMKQILEIGYCGEELRFASDRLKDDNEFVLQALKKADQGDRAGFVASYASPRLVSLFENSKQDVIKVVETDMAFRNLQASLSKSNEIKPKRHKI